MDFFKQHQITYQKNINLSKYTTYRLTGTADFLVMPKNIDELVLVLHHLKTHHLKHMILGNGSNLIFVKQHYDGTLIKLDSFNQLEINKNIITVASGYSLIKLAYETANLSLSGLEFASGIPGTIGGSIYMNAGAYNKSMSDLVSAVTVLDKDLNIRTLPKEDLHFNYRTSIFQQNRDYIILEATLILEESNKDDILDLINDRKKRRLASQPLNYPSAGSVFRNPDNDHAGRLIEELGYKGKTFGDLEVSNKHANFIINKGTATGNEIKNLIYHIKKDVKAKYNIDLIIEQELIE